MNKYDNAKIYKLTSSQTDKVYIGSTICPLKERFRLHKKDYKRWLKGQHNKITSYDLLKYDDCKIELIKEFPCETKEQLLKQEGKYILPLPSINHF